MKIIGRLVDIHLRNIYPAAITLSDGKIQKIEKIDSSPEIYILPGLIDAHIHIESSMVTPGAFAVAAVRHGTCSVVSDPHEIANVLGGAGVRYMIEDGRKVPLKFNFGAPSCVPATSFESNGATLDHTEVQNLLEMDEIKYLSEMMNYPGVINEDREVMLKLEEAKRLRKPVDGHAPGLSGDNLKKYISAGISTDHECSSISEAEEKIKLGMKILIREGSAAKNLDTLKALYKSNPEMLMLCSDDLHPEMLEKGHINRLIARLISEGYDIFDVVRSATISPAEHYSLSAGLLRPGDQADFILIENLQNMHVRETWIDGEKVFENGNVLFDYIPGKPVNNFNCNPIDAGELKIRNQGSRIRVITAIEGELLTGEIHNTPHDSSFISPDIAHDILKIVVKDRYRDFPPAVGFIKGFGLKTGALASSIAHDSHNIIAVGTNDMDLADAINEIVTLKGGLAVADNGNINSLRLNIAGIMTTRPCEEIAHDHESLCKLVRSLGCPMNAPFMTLSFMALLVIPNLKIGDQGLFDVNKFTKVSLFV